MDFVEQLKSSIDIVKVAGEYVRLRRIGATGRGNGAGDEAAAELPGRG